MMINPPIGLDLPKNYLDAFQSYYTIDPLDSTAKKTYAVMLFVFSILCPLVPVIGFFACWIMDLCIKQPSEHRTPPPLLHKKPVANLHAELPTIAKVKQTHSATPRRDPNVIIDRTYQELLAKAREEETFSNISFSFIFARYFWESARVFEQLEAAKLIRTVIERIIQNDFAKLSRKAQLDFYIEAYRFFGGLDHLPSFPLIQKELSLDLFQPVLESEILPAFREVDPTTLPASTQYTHYCHDRLYELLLNDINSSEENAIYERLHYITHLIETKEETPLLKEMIDGVKILPGSLLLRFSLESILEKVIHHDLPTLSPSKQRDFYIATYRFFRERQEENRLSIFNVIPVLTEDDHIQYFQIRLYQALMHTLQIDKVNVLAKLEELESLIDRRRENLLSSEIIFSGEKIEVLPGAFGTNFSFETVLEKVMKEGFPLLSIGKRQNLYLGIYEFSEKHNRAFPSLENYPETITDWLPLCGFDPKDAGPIYQSLQEFIESDGEEKALVAGKIFKVRGKGDSSLRIASLIHNVLKVIEISFMEKVQFLVKAEKFFRSRGWSFGALEPTIPLTLIKEDLEMKINVPLSRFVTLEYFTPIYSGLYQDAHKQEVRAILPEGVHIQQLIEVLSTPLGWDRFASLDTSSKVSIQQGLDLLGSSHSLAETIESVSAEDLISIQSELLSLSGHFQQMIFSQYANGCSVEAKKQEISLIDFWRTEQGGFGILPFWMQFHLLKYLFNNGNLRYLEERTILQWPLLVRFIQEEGVDEIVHSVSYEVYQSFTSLVQDCNESVITLPKELSKDHIPFLLKEEINLYSTPLSFADALAIQNLKIFFGDRRPIKYLSRITLPIENLESMLGNIDTLPQEFINELLVPLLVQYIVYHLRKKMDIEAICNTISRMNGFESFRTNYPLDLNLSSKTPIQSKELETIVRFFPRIRSLDITYTKIDALPSGLFELERLVISQIRNSVDISALDHSKTLKTLHLSGHIKRLPTGCQALEECKLNCLDETTDISELRKIKTIKILVVDSCDQFTGAINNTSLEIFVVKDCDQFTDISSLNNSEKLRFIYIKDSPISEAPLGCSNLIKFFTWNASSTIDVKHLQDKGNVEVRVESGSDRALASSSRIAFLDHPLLSQTRKDNLLRTLF